MSGQISWFPTQQQWSQWPQGYYPPPCPYPTGPSQWPRPSQSAPASILGPRPQSFVTQSHPGSTPSQCPTDITADVHTLSLTPPDAIWYMDTGATNHMTSSSGTHYPIETSII